MLANQIRAVLSESNTFWDIVGNQETINFLRSTSELLWVGSAAISGTHKKWWNKKRNVLSGSSWALYGSSHAIPLSLKKEKTFSAPICTNKVGTWFMVILPDNQKHRNSSLAYLCNTWELQQGSECVSVQAQTSEAHNKLKFFSPELPPFFQCWCCWMLT